MEPYQTLSIATYMYSILFIGIVGVWWSTSNMPNKFVKFFVLTMFSIGVYLGVNMITEEPYGIWCHFIVGFSLVTSFILLFAKSDTSIWTTAFKFLCLLNVISSIIHFSI